MTRILSTVSRFAYALIAGALIVAAQPAEAEEYRLLYDDYYVQGSMTIDVRSALMTAYPHARAERIDGVSINGALYRRQDIGSAYLTGDHGSYSPSVSIGAYFQDQYIGSHQLGRSPDLVIVGPVILREVVVYVTNRSWDDGRHDGDGWNPWNPGPETPPPSPVRTEFIYCDSGKSPCYPSGRIVQARISRDFTGHCRLNENWGVEQSYIWTSGWCRANFEVEVQ